MRIAITTENLMRNPIKNPRLYHTQLIGLALILLACLFAVVCYLTSRSILDSAKKMLSGWNG